MSHSTEIVGYKKLNDEQFAVCIRCCGNASTDHWHEMKFTADPIQRAANLDAERDKVVSRHKAAISGESIAIELMGSVKEHS